LQGAFVTPGFIDPHVHFVKASQMLSQPSLRDAAEPQGIRRAHRRGGQRACPRASGSRAATGTRIAGAAKCRTSRGSIAFTPDTPVAVIRYDLHMLLLNSLALKLAGIDRNTPDVPGGVIERDAKGEPTGIIKDAAKDLVLARSATRPPSRSTPRHARASSSHSARA
jgi:predicted amidohydrolase YtcJ